jgi:hypothetical protein
VSKHYSFRIQKDENYWEGIQRLAEEVNWRAFMSGGVFYYVSEEDLYQTQRPRYRFSEDDDGIVGIDFDWNHRKRVGRATATIRINRWAIPPGTTVLIEGLGPANRKWLVESVTRNLFSAEATLELKQPMVERKEPKPELKESQSTLDDVHGVLRGGTVGERCLQAAKEIHKHRYPYVWGGGHRHAGRPDGGTGRDPGIGYDCSGGVAACLKRAGVMPASWNDGVPGSSTMASSYGHHGEGRTMTLWANGSHVFLIVKVGGRHYHLGTGRFGKSFGGFGVNAQMHTTAGFVPRHHPSDTRGTAGTGHEYMGGPNGTGHL